VEDIMKIKDAGAQACIDETWDGTNYTGTCVDIPDDAEAIETSTGKLQGKYEDLSDGGWKGSGTCIYAMDGGDEIHESWEEGSHLKEYTYRYTGGTGKYAKISGGGTYNYDEHGAFAGGRYNGTLNLT
jgi:hypothetical protein